MGNTEKDPETIIIISISCLVLSCLWVINTISCFIQVSYWLTLKYMINMFRQIQFSHVYNMMFIWREQVFIFDISCCFFILSQMDKTFSVNIPNIGVLIHNSYSCPKMSTPTHINGLCLMTSFIIVML